MSISLLNQPFILPLRQVLCGIMLVLGVFQVPVADAQTALQLPFFEDFTASVYRLGSERPDPKLWQPGSGVYVNNTMALNQPTQNVATFDGLQANGRPYVRDNPLDQGYTDTLESRPINLAGLSAANGVYLSFYWEIKGLGELPDPGDTLTKLPGVPPTLQPGDSLTLQFRDVSGIWKTVWAQVGGQADSLFHQVFIPVTNSAYLNGNFAFRFRSFGRRSGPFDTWHVDYIYLNQGRSANDRFIKDLATRRKLSPLLKRYTAMPLSQYKIKGAAELADSVTTDINNLFNNFNRTSVGFRVYNGTSTVLQYDTLFTQIAALGSKQLAFKPTPRLPATADTSFQLRYEVALKTSDNENPIFQRDPFTLLRNDTIAAVATLSNYYAYDDGAWEYAQQIRQREQVAVRFILNKPDTVGSVRLCIVPFSKDQTGQAFVMTVYTNSNGKPGAALYQQSFQIQYPATRNGFIEYRFTRNIIVKDTFYVGYQQISSSDTTFLRLGFDKNSPFGANIFYNGGSSWEQNLQVGPNGSPSSLQVPGAFMLRPVMGARNAVVTAVEEPEPVAPLQVYPNPTTGLIRWDNPKVTRLEVISRSGQTLLTHVPARGQQTLDLSYLPDGFYLLRLFSDQRAVVQKLIIQH